MKKPIKKTEEKEGSARRERRGAANL